MNIFNLPQDTQSKREFDFCYNALLQLQEMFPNNMIPMNLSKIILQELETYHRGEFNILAITNLILEILNSCKVLKDDINGSRRIFRKLGTSFNSVPMNILYQVITDMGNEPDMDMDRDNVVQRIEEVEKFLEPLYKHLIWIASERNE